MTTAKNIPEPDLNYLQKVLLEMLAIPSPTGFTDTIVRYVAERLEELGIPFELTRRGTIRATLKGKQSSPDRAVSAHLDTIGAAVREVKDNGRLSLAPIGCWSSRFAEGSRVSVFTDSGVIRGSVLPLMASGHAFNTAVDEMPISWDHVELRLDAYATTKADCESLGIGIGDFVAFDPLPEFTESGHISARHLDDKAGVAALLAALKAIVDSGAEPQIDCHPLFTITEETGTGAAGVLPWDVSEFVGIDIAPVAPGEDGHTYNINADTFAGAIAGALGATRLLFLTDVPGVLDKKGGLIKELTVKQVRKLIADGTISGGMIPKVETCIYALEAGVQGVVIIDGKTPHAVLLELFTNQGTGTLIHK